MTTDPLAELLVKAIEGPVGDGEISLPAWLREHRDELLTALGGEKFTDYETARFAYQSAPPKAGQRLWANMDTWLHPGDEVWQLYGSEGEG